ncbi:hypothetical protein NMG60_11037212 [Bertholletia excelsa]
MAKMSVVAAALLALLVLGQATAFRTTVTTTLEEEQEENPRGRSEQQCREQMERQQQLNHCRMYLRQQMEESPYQNPRPLRRGEEPHLDECCEQLERMDEMCRCEGLRMMMRRQREEMELQGEQMQRIMRKAENLLSRCNLSPQRCPMGGYTAWL